MNDCLLSASRWDVFGDSLDANDGSATSSGCVAKV